MAYPSPRLTALSLVIVLSLLSPFSHATEGAGGVYPNGITDFMVGVLPPPGTYLLNSVGHYQAASFKNPGLLFQDIDFSITSESVRIVHITEKRLLGARYGNYVVAAFLDMNLRAANLHLHKAGFADLVVAPAILGWDRASFHGGGGIDINLPSGKYQSSDFLNPGRHYYAFTPFLFATLFAQGGPELSAKVMFDINSKNDASDYRSGNELHADYAAGWHFGQKLIAGAGGYYYRQMTPDKGSGARFGDFKGRVASAGPYLSYKFGSFSLTIKVQHEMGARNRSEGDKYWLKTVMVF